jgi:hypothetical protein
MAPRAQRVLISSFLIVQKMPFFSGMPHQSSFYIYIYIYIYI